MKSTVVLVLFLISFVLYVKAAIDYQTTPGQTTVTTSSITLKITGGSNVPKFSFGVKQANSTTGSSDDYSVMFQKVYQVDSSGKKIGPTNVALPSYGWTFRDFNQGSGNNTLSFTLESTTIPKGNPYLGVVVHLTDTATNFKFDVGISNVTWNAAASKLYFCFNFQQKGSNATLGTSQSNRVTFGGAYFSITPTATVPDANNKQVNATLLGDADTDASSYCIAYDNWNSTLRLVQDPTVGLTSPGTSPGSAAGTITFTITSIVFIISLVLMVLL
ncbi:hypothetical protein ABK040_006308 [Willaertia magna]